MMNYKQMCIIGYFLAGLCAVHHWMYENKHIDTPVTETMMNFYFIGGLITLYCAYKWFTKQEYFPNM